MAQHINQISEDKHKTRKDMALTSKRVSVLLGNKAVTRQIVDAVKAEKRGETQIVYVPSKLVNRIVEE